jgi:hypothetical protein
MRETNIPHFGINPLLDRLALFILFTKLLSSHLYQSNPRFRALQGLDQLMQR